MAGRPRVIADRIMKVLVDSPIFVSIDEVRDLLANKGWIHGFNVVQRNLDYLHENEQIIESVFEKNKFKILDENDARDMFNMSLDVVLTFMTDLSESERKETWRLLRDSLKTPYDYVMKARERARKEPS